MSSSTNICGYVNPKTSTNPFISQFSYLGEKIWICWCDKKGYGISYNPSSDWCENTDSVKVKQE